MKVGERVVFNYPTEFVTLPEYTAHAGQIVTATRMLGADEADTSLQPMWEIIAADGWIGNAFEDELSAVSRAVCPICLTTD